MTARISLLGIVESILILPERLHLAIIIHEEDIKQRQALLPRVDGDVGLLGMLHNLLEAEDVVGEVVVGAGTLVRDVVGAEADVAAVYVPEALVENVLSSAEFEETVVSAGAEVEEVVVDAEAVPAVDVVDTVLISLDGEAVLVHLGGEADYVLVT